MKEQYGFYLAGLFVGVILQLLNQMFSYFVYLMISIPFAVGVYALLLKIGVNSE